MTHDSKVSRRSFLKSVAAGAGAVSTPAVLTACGSDDDDNDERALSVFDFGHGVASGDPLTDRVIIWTRITPDQNTGQTATVEWSVATDSAMRDIIKTGRVDTDASVDYTVKVDVTGLEANTTYYYQFKGQGSETVIGRTKTLPTGDVANAKLAVCSCANFPFGNFNVYKEIANSDADAVVHLGDYIYEYESGVYPDVNNIADNRQLDPTEEIITLDQYRARYNQYRRDADLQSAHQNAPFICVWDDHELANDAFKDGAENHNDDEGSFADRRAAAFQAYHEWLPIRTGDDLSVIDRSFDFGNLLSLHMLDTRQVARTEPLSYGDFLTSSGLDAAAFADAVTDSERTLLGNEQQSRTIDRMVSSTATWQVLGQQVVMGRILVPQELLQKLGEIQALIEAGADASTAQAETALLLQELATIKGRILAGDPTVPADDAARVAVASGAPYNLDAWDGYVDAREQILQRAQFFNKNLVVLAGDTHNAWASDLYPLNSNASGLGDVNRAGGSVGVEFATASVTSPGFEDTVALSTPALQQGFEVAVTTLVDDLKYLNAANRGYMLVEFTKQKATCEWRFVSDILTTNYTANVGKKMEVLPGAGKRMLNDITPVA